MSIGERIKRLRVERGISQTDLAAKIQSTKQTLYKYENNIITNIPSDKLEKIASVLNASPAYLMGWTDDKKVSSVSVSGVKKTGEYYTANETLTQMLETISQLPDDAIAQLDNYIKFLVHEYKNKGVDEA